MNRNTKICLGLLILLTLISIIALVGIDKKINMNNKNYSSQATFKIISSTENKDLEDILENYAQLNEIKLQIDYAGTLDIIEKLNNGEQYNAVWMSNSIWLYMLDDNVTLKNSKSTSINPVVFGITKTKAEELGFVGTEVYTKDILEAIKQGKLKFNMSSVTQTNTGATAYLGFLSTIAGNPEVLKTSDLENEQLKTSLTELFKGVTRSSGSDEFLEDMFLKGEYEAVVTYETSLISINQKLEAEGKEPLYIIYPKDGVSISDSPFAYIYNKNDDRLEDFTKIQNYILSNDGQTELAKTGRRVWYGGINENADKSIFNPGWGIDTTKYIVPVKYPSATVIKQALQIYQTELRKPIHAVFCLDYSGSMRGNGNIQLEEAMSYILTEEEAAKNFLQFSSKDKITVIPFNNKILDTWTTNNGTDTQDIIENIMELEPNAGTNIYTPSISALDILNKEDLENYNVSIILMTDGNSNDGSYIDLTDKYREIKKDIPIFSIMFGNATEDQLEEIAELTNAKVFDGRTDLLNAFKQVRGYN